MLLSRIMQPSRTPQPNLLLPAPRGRPFAKGNSGRKAGSKNRATVVAAALLDGEAEALMRKAVELALAGDVVMLKFFVDRMLPRERRIKLDLPRLDFADDAVAAIGIIIGALAEGKISPSEGAALAALVETFRRAIDEADVVKRLDALEAKINGDGVA
jgi:hypothetical protein